MATAKTLQNVGSAILNASPLEKAVAKNAVQRKPKLPQGKGVGATAPLHTGPVIAYQINALPVWTSKPKVNSAAYSQTTDQGYDIEAMRLNEVRRALAMARANGALSTGNDPNVDTKMPFFVTDVGIDWALTGTTAQSRLTRDFYPHNFTQATFMIKGVSLSQYEYGEMVEFIHQAQHDALNGGNGNLIQLDIFDLNPNPDPKTLGPLDGQRKTVTRGVRTASQVIGDLNFPNQIMRGHHADIRCQGYVSGMHRRHQKGVFVPTWQLSFTVAVMIDGPYKEELHSLKKQKNWTDMLKVTPGLFQTAWYEQNDKASLDWVRREAPIMFNVTQTAPSSDASSSALGGQWIKVGFTVYNDSAPGAGGLNNNEYCFAELGTARSTDGGATGHGNLSQAFGNSGGKPELPMGTKIQARNGNKHIEIVKRDRGYGQGGDGVTSDPHYAIDLWTAGTKNPAQALGVSGSGDIEVMVPGGGSVAAPGGDAQTLAKSILDSGKATYSGRFVQSDLQAAADGQPGSAGAMQNKEILQLIAAIVAKHTVDISALQSGGSGHSPGSDHYKGNAVDFDQLDGVSITGRNTPAVTIITLAMSVMSGGWFGQSGCGPTPTLPPSWSTGTDTCNHLHVSFR